MEPRYEPIKNGQGDDLMSSICNQLNGLPWPDAWNEFFKLNQYAAVINLFKDYCGYNENKDDDNSLTAQAKNLFTLHKNNTVVLGVLRAVLHYYSVEECSKDPDFTERRTEYFTSRFFLTLEAELRKEGKFLNPTGSLVKRIHFAQLMLNKQYIDLLQLCFDLSAEKLREVAAVKNNTVEVVEPAEDLSTRLRPGIVEQLNKLPKPEKWEKFFLTTSYDFHGLQLPVMTTTRKCVDTYEAVINLFQDYCNPASHFFTSHQHSHTQVVLRVLEKALAKFSMQDRAFREADEAVKFFFDTLEKELRYNNQYLNPTGSLVKRINFAAAYDALNGTDDYLPQLCIDLSNEMINLRKSQKDVGNTNNTNEMHEDRGEQEEEHLSSCSM